MTSFSELNALLAMASMVTHLLTRAAGCIRAADLTSRDVQLYWDRELFWIVKNGIRLSGMPAFRKVETDEHIWNLAQFVRTLRDSTNPH